MDTSHTALPAADKFTTLASRPPQGAALRIAMIGSRGVGSGYGGIERMLDSVCPALAARGHRVDVYSRTNVVFNDIDLPGGGQVHAVRTPAVNSKHLESISRSVLALGRAMRRYDLIHFHATGPGILAAATRLFRQTSLVTVHGLDHERAKWGRFAKICLGAAERSLVANADGISVVSEGLRRYFLEAYDTAACLVPNGLPVVRRVAPGALLDRLGVRAGRYLLFASRLTPEKACHELIAAFNALPTDMHLVIAGGSGTAAYVAALHAQADPARVRFAGHQTGNALGELFSNAYAFLLPSHIEGMSMALLEAVAFELPVLVSDIAENRAVIGDAGRYFPVGDVGALRAQLAWLVAHPEAVAAMADRLAEPARADWANVAARYEELYYAALARRRRLVAIDDMVLAGSRDI